jgi:hypothetical protein
MRAALLHFAVPARLRAQQRARQAACCAARQPSPGTSHPLQDEASARAGCLSCDGSIYQKYCEEQYPCNSTTGACTGAPVQASSAAELGAACTYDTAYLSEPWRCDAFLLPRETDSARVCRPPPRQCSAASAGPVPVPPPACPTAARP